MSDTTEDRLVLNALALAGFKEWVSVNTWTVPWNANQWAYHRRTRVHTAATDPALAQAIYDALTTQPLGRTTADITLIKGDYPRLRPQVVVTWR